LTHRGVEDWRIDYNMRRPHSAHRELTPAEFAHVGHEEARS